MVNYYRPKILIIDDEQEARDLLESYLEQQGYMVMSAPDGEEGLKMAQKYHVDIIICDIYMPKMDGIEFLKTIRQYNSKVQVILITGSPSFETTFKSVDNSACDYLVKPVKREMILQSIQKAERNLTERTEVIARGLLVNKPKNKSRIFE